MKTTTKYFLTGFTIALISSCGVAFGQEVELTNQPTQPGLDVHVGDTDLAIIPSQFNVRDQDGNLVTSVAFLSVASFLPSDTQITDTLYAVTPPDPNNNNLITGIVMYHADPSQAIDSNEILNTVQDRIHHNYLWAGAQFTVRAIKPTTQISTTTTADIYVQNQTISFTAGGINYNLSVPNAQITFSPTATSATTVYNTTTNTWVTIPFKARAIT